MTITLYSNFFNHHQKPLCDAFDGKKGIIFRFVEMEPMPESFKKAGYVVPEVNYLVKAHENNKQMTFALNLIETSDVVIFGAVYDYLFDRRIGANKLTFKYSERVFRKPWHIWDPRRIWHLFKHNTRFRKNNFYLLCAGAFVANDFKKVFAFPNKMLKWGYFTKTQTINIQKIIDDKKNRPAFKILFVGRLIPLKNIEHILNWGEQLKKSNKDFFISIVGVGPMYKNLVKQADKMGISKNIKFFNNIPNEEVFKKMQESDVLIFPSNKEEGWGAVVNESLSNGCPIIIGNKIGAAPFLVKEKITGLVYNTDQPKELICKGNILIKDNRLRSEMAKNGYSLMTEIWSPENTVNRFLKFCKSRDVDFFNEGPMSKAKKTSYNWYK